MRLWHCCSSRWKKPAARWCSSVTIECWPRLSIGSRIWLSCPARPTGRCSDMLLGLARASLWNRRTTVALTLVSLSIGIALLLGIDHLRHQAKDSFRQTLSGTDLIVGPRGGQTNLLLYSVFQMGQP